MYGLWPRLRVATPVSMIDTSEAPLGMLAPAAVQSVQVLMHAIANHDPLVLLKLQFTMANGMYARL